MSQSTDSANATVTVDHIGGIDQCELSIVPGVTVLTGRNATNRTSFLMAVAGVLGGSQASLKSDAGQGSVTLEWDGETYTRQYARQNGETVITGGTPYTERSELVDLFACILESNPARRAVERGDDIRDLIMRPVDTDDIHAQIQAAKRDREQLSARLDEIDHEQNRLPTLEDRREQLREELDDLTTELDELRQEVAEFEADEDTAETADTLLTQLDSKRQELTDTRNRIQTHRSSIEALEDERDQLQRERDTLEAPDRDRQEIERDLDQVQARERELEATITDLSALVDVNEELVTGELSTFHSDDNDVTARLDPTSETIECWTCGSHVERTAITEQLEELHRLIEDKRDTRKDLQERIEGLRDARQELNAVEERRSEIDDRLAEIERECTRREAQITDLEATVEELEDEIQALEREVEATEELRESELLEQYQRLSDLEYERGQVESELTDIQDEIEQIEAVEAEREQVEAQREQVQEELASLRTRIEDIEQTAVDAFNEHMAEVLGLLEYENLERVWIERQSGPSPTSEGTFELHVVRETTDGAVYEDTVDHLSESEREVVGLIVALAGYLVHDVADEVPMMLLDSLEAIDADRIARLVEYFAEQSSYLLVALLPEDAQALADSYPRVSVEAAEA